MYLHDVQLNQNQMALTLVAFSFTACIDRMFRYMVQKYEQILDNRLMHVLFFSLQLIILECNYFDESEFL